MSKLGVWLLIIGLLVALAGQLLPTTTAVPAYGELEQSARKLNALTGNSHLNDAAPIGTADIISPLRLHYREQLTVWGLALFVTGALAAIIARAVRPPANAK